MEMPVTCCMCHNMIELTDCNFFVKFYCRCVDSCDHGLCDECKDEGENNG